jgi:hypothetical protein
MARMPARLTDTATIIRTNLMILMLVTLADSTGMLRRWLAVPFLTFETGLLSGRRQLDLT